MKELVLKRKAAEEAYNLFKSNDYKQVLIENLPKCFMSLKKIYDFMDTNNYLSNDVIRKAENNPFVPIFFVRECMWNLKEEYRQISGDGEESTYISLFEFKGAVNNELIIMIEELELDNELYRMKTMEELENERRLVDKRWERVK